MFAGVFPFLEGHPFLSFIVVVIVALLTSGGVAAKRYQSKRKK